MLEVFQVVTAARAATKPPTATRADPVSEAWSSMERMNLEELEREE